MSETEDAIAELRAKLKLKERECEKLKEENETLQKRMQEMEGRMRVEIRNVEERIQGRMEARLRTKVEEEMQEKMEEKMELKVCEMMRELAGMDGAIASMVKTSTPVLGKEWLLKPKEKGEPEKVKDQGDGEKKKKKSSKKRRHERKLKARMSKSTDSLYSSVSGEEVKEKVDTDEDDSSSSSSSDEGVDAYKGLVIREVPRIDKFLLYGSQDIEDFFRKYENYCKRKVGEDDRYWVKELGEFLEGRLADYYRIMIEDGDQKYDEVKERIIEFVKRVKGGVKYKKRNAFDEARMREGESLEGYACRLESAARKRFGREGINENKELMRKFLATVPNRVYELINARRKEKMRSNGTRLMWFDVLEMIEDRVFDENERRVLEGQSVYMGREASSGNRFATYCDAVQRKPVEIVAQYLMDFYENGSGDVRKEVYVGNHQSRSRYERRDQNMGARRDRSASRGRSSSGNRSNGTNGRETRCFRCNKVGHVMSDCRWAKGACFGCGKMGHLIGNCPSPKPMKCYSCGGSGHRANECRSMNDRSKVCGNCGQRGHFARMCNVPMSECEKCGVRGHVASVCYRTNVQGNGTSVRVEGSGSANGMAQGN